jgi:flagellar motor protein MotB
MEDDILDFNFWPSFADLMLALVLILLLLLFMFTAVITIGTVNLEHIQKKQLVMVNSIAASYGVKAAPLPNEKDAYGISINVPNNYDIEIRNEPTLQRITFSDKILFEKDRYQITDKGRDTLLKVGQALKNMLPAIREIQIQGHADPDKTARYDSNVHLAAFRAIEVFRFLQKDVSIDPASHLMSASSFGEFKPLTRPQDGSNYDQEKLMRDNLSEEQKSKNRRIELLLFY